MKIQRAIFFALLYLFLPALLSAKPQNEKQEVKIVAILPLTGGQARAGEDMRRILTLLAEQYSTQSERYRYSFTFEDGRCGAGNLSVSAAKKLFHFQKITFYITGCSGETMQAAQLLTAPQAATPSLLIAIFSSHPKIKTLGPFVFRTYIDQERGLGTFAHFLRDQGHKRIALFSEESVFTFGIRNILKQELGGFLLKV